MKHALNKIALLSLLILLPLTSFGKRKYTYNEGFYFKKESAEVKVTNVKILPGWGGLIIDISVQNKGNDVFNFFVDDVEILNSSNNEGHYSFSKGKSVATIPYIVGTDLQRMNILVGNTEINPNRTVSGTILILAGKEQLKSLKNFDMIYAGQTLKVTSKK